MTLRAASTVSLLLLPLLLVGCPVGGSCTTNEDCPGAMFCVDRNLCGADDDDSAEDCTPDNACVTEAEAGGYWE